jgi:hypothetical protein
MVMNSLLFGSVSKLSSPLLVTLALLGTNRCDDHAGGQQDGGCDPGGHDAGSPRDAGQREDAGADCAVGSYSEAEIGAAGGELDHCGARVAIAAGALDSVRNVRLTVVALPDGAPSWLEPAGAAFDVEVEGGVPPAAQPPLSVLVPHASTTRSLYFYRYDAQDGYQPIEACTVTDRAIGQDVSVGGTFVALMDREDFPDSTDGLGSGTIDATFMGEQRSYDLDDDGFATFAIYDEAVPGEWSVTLSVAQVISDVELRRVLIKLAIANDGTATLIEVTYGSTAAPNGLWSYLPFDPEPPAITVTRDGQGIVGSLEVELRSGDATELLSADFDVTVDKFRYPPELACGFPEG